MWLLLCYNVRRQCGIMCCRCARCAAADAKLWCSVARGSQRSVVEREGSRNESRSGSQDSKIADERSGTIRSCVRRAKCGEQEPISILGWSEGSVRKKRPASTVTAVSTKKKHTARIPSRRTTRATFAYRCREQSNHRNYGCRYLIAVRTVSLTRSSKTFGGVPPATVVGWQMGKWVERQTRLPPLPVPLGQIKLTDMEQNRQSTKHSSSKAGPLEPLFLSPLNAYSLKALTLLANSRHGVQVDSPQEPRLRVKSGGCGQPETPRQITARFHAAAAYRTGKLSTDGAICKLTFFVRRRYIPSIFSY